MCTWLCKCTVCYTFLLLSRFECTVVLCAYCVWLCKMFQMFCFKCFICSSSHLYAFFIYFTNVAHHWFIYVQSCFWDILCASGLQHILTWIGLTAKWHHSCSPQHQQSCFKQSQGWHSTRGFVAVACKFFPLFDLTRLSKGCGGYAEP